MDHHVGIVHVCSLSIMINPFVTPLSSVEWGGQFGNFVVEVKYMHNNVHRICIKDSFPLMLPLTANWLDNSNGEFSLD